MSRRDDGVVWLLLLAWLFARKAPAKAKGSGIVIDVDAAGGAASGHAHGEAHDDPAPASHPE